MNLKQYVSIETIKSDKHEEIRAYKNGTEFILIGLHATYENGKVKKAIFFNENGIKIKTLIDSGDWVDDSGNVVNEWTPKHLDLLMLRPFLDSEDGLNTCLYFVGENYKNGFIIKTYAPI